MWPRLFLALQVAKTTSAYRVLECCVKNGARNGHGSGALQFVSVFGEPATTTSGWLSGEHGYPYLATWRHFVSHHCRLGLVAHYKKRHNLLGVAAELRVDAVKHGLVVLFLVASQESGAARVGTATREKHVYISTQDISTQSLLD